MIRAQMLLLMLVALACAARMASAQTVSADLSSHLVAITTGFTGTSVVLFGATDGPADVIAVVRGPERSMVVRRKSRVAGIWMNTRAVTFEGVPSYYALYSTRPLAEIAPPAMQALHQIGLENLRFTGADARTQEDRDMFRAALIDEQRRQGLYLKEPGQVAFLGNRLFRATIDFPANVPTGTYLFEVFLVRDKAVVSGQTTPLVVSQIGFDADVNEFAERRSLAYGLLAVAGAAMAGWLASLPFRNA
ncbi:MAG TPA: TIGR02186 family protein [Stellaceae bacterium]|nr:TIGR02186 family protein [Stellaceae bacterium]